MAEQYCSLCNAMGCRPSRRRMKPVKASLIVGVLALALFSARLGEPSSYVFDEISYVNAARALVHGAAGLQMEPNEWRHWGWHPPLGKVLMAASMVVCGDNPFGWRFGSAVAGAIAIASTLLLTYLLLDSLSLAVLASVLMLLNNFTFVLSRVAMAEAFIMMFVITGLTAWVAAVKGIYPRWMLLLAGVLFGCAVSVKWSALVLLAVLALCTVVLWFKNENVGRVGLGFVALSQGAVPLLTYCLSFWPVCRTLNAPFSLPEVWSMTVFIFDYHHHATGNPAINSPWYAWVLRTSPERSLNYMVGNFAVCWLGIVALVVCLYRFIKKPALAEGLVVILYGASLLQWPIIARNFTFYYYYAIPATFLCVAIPIALRRNPGWTVLGVRVTLLCGLAAAVVFLVFYPKMAALNAPWDCALVCVP
jgi:dolichyl-phosphate-mannose-protein mannosyltransferase